jgi:hypothetical protein
MLEASSEASLGGGAAEAKPAGKRAPPEFRLARLIFLQVKEVDPIAQTFGAHILYDFVVKNGSKDPELWDGTDDSDSPGFRSASWYWHKQVDFPNAKDYTIHERKIREIDGTDLNFSLRLTGTFYQCFSLEDYPFDFQSLEVVFEMKCAAEGPAPVVLRVPDKVDYDAGVDIESFHHYNVWCLASQLEVLETSTGMLSNDPKKQKTYAAIASSAQIVRLCTFHVVNILMPIAMFSILTIFPHFFISADLVFDRVTVSVTLLLTSAAYKFVISNLIPLVSYLTFLDRYMMSIFILQSLAVFQNSLLGSSNLAKHTPIEKYDEASLCSLIAVDVLIHVYFAFVGLRLHHRSWEHIKKYGRLKTFESSAVGSWACGGRCAPRIDRRTRMEPASIARRMSGRKDRRHSTSATASMANRV